MEKTAPPKSPSTAARLTPAEARRAQQKARKHAAREAALKQEAARRRRNAALGVLAAVVVVAVAIFLITSLGGSSKKKSSTASDKASASASAAGTPSPTASTPAAPFPPVPAGADKALKTEPKVTAGSGTVSALKVTTLIKGTGAAVANGQSVTVNYVGATYADGKEFDSSWSRSQAFSFTIGQGGVIKGWDQGLLGVKVGSRVQLDIPQSLAYPDASSANGEPVGTLRFVVDVLAAGPAS